MEINFTISKEELVNFHMNHVTETKNYKNAIIGNTFFMILFIIFVFLIKKIHKFVIIEQLENRRSDRPSVLLQNITNDI